MNTALWVMQGFLALIFLSTGLIKLTRPAEQVRKLIPPVFPMGFVRWLGGLEVLGAAGITLPWLTGILPVLTPISAIGMSIVMVGAIILHVREHEMAKLPFVSTVLLLALFVTYARLALVG